MPFHQTLRFAYRSVLTAALLLPTLALGAHVENRPKHDLYESDTAAYHACEADRAAEVVDPWPGGKSAQCAVNYGPIMSWTIAVLGEEKMNLCPNRRVGVWEYRYWSSTSTNWKDYFFCIDGYIQCPSSSTWNQPAQRCDASMPILAQLREDKGLACQGSAPSVSPLVSNPCNPATGNKYQTETDYVGQANGLALVRHYNSLLGKDVGFGTGWTTLSGKRLESYDATVQVRRGDGRGEPFTCPTSGRCGGDPDSALALSRDTGGYTLSAKDGASGRYDPAGRLQSETDREGRTTSYGYDGSNRLTTVTGPFGHALGFAYDASGHVGAVTTPAGVYAYAYGAVAGGYNLTAVTYPDGARALYHYENASFPHHLTGISYQEPGGTPVRYATYAYDGNGKAISTEHAGGMERHTLGYDSDTQTTVTDAGNTSQVYSFQANLGLKNLVSRYTAADGKSLNQTFDANNNLTCKKDEEGRVTTYSYNSTNQRTAMTEGLIGDCGNPLNTAAARTTTYQYLSATLDLPTMIQSPSVYGGASKTTTMAYDANRNPTVITQSGYTPAGAAVARTVTLTYNARGQVTSIDGARTDVSDVTTLAYYDCNTAGACGQLRAVTNALGHVTTFDTYDGNGRVTQTTDPNGLRTAYGYDLRGRVTTVTETPAVGAARTTQYMYNAAGNVTFVGFPDGRSLTYAYDAAQKLQQVSDNLGHKVVYGYDLKGNRTEEALYDPANTLVRSIATAYDRRNRISAVNHGGALTQQVHDAIGNLTSVTDPNQVASGSGLRTTHGYDALNRLFETVNNLSGSTSYGYDAADRLNRVRAPNGATTEYRYDDLGNLLQELSPDRGTISYSYDAAGNVRAVTDARGIVTSYSYDALNRLLVIDTPTATDVAYTYDSNPTGLACSGGLGRLCRVADGAGVSEYAYDGFGNVSESRKTELGRAYMTQYTYDAGDRVTSITYPDNRVVTYSRDTLGRVVGVTTTINGTTQTILSNRTYRADGLFLSQTYGNGVDEVRQYDLKGQLTYQSLGSADTRLYQYDPNGNLTQKQTLPEVGTYTYDALDRLAEETAGSDHNAYTYDANGNRLSDLRANGTTRAYQYEPQTNRLTQIGNQTLTRDLAGNTTSDRNGNRTFTYDEAGRLTQVSINGALRGTYTYNYQNQRTRKVRTVTHPTTGETRTVTLVFHYDIDGHLIAETRPNGKLVRAYIGADGEPIAQIQNRPAQQTEELVYLHVDHLATPRLATDATQTVVWRNESEAFGIGKPETDPDADDSKTNVRLRFAGQYADGETGLYYNHNRYYDPKTGRYVTSDPIGLDGDLNTYLYAYANPLRYTDPTGLRGPGVGGGIRVGPSGTIIGPPVSGSYNSIFPKMGSDPLATNLPMMTSGFGGSAANDSQCRPDDDPCEVERKRLENNRKAGDWILKATNTEALNIKQYNNFARQFNKGVNLHNLYCPKHQVKPLPLIPLGPLGTVE